MHAATYKAFRDELVKIAYHSVADIAGLAALAVPTVQKVRGKPMSEKATHAAELGGLGVLAGTSAHKIYSAVREGGLKAIKHASVCPAVLLKKADVDLWNPSTGAVHSGVGGTRASNLGVSVGSAAKSAKKPAFTLAHLKDAYSKAGLKPGLGSAVRSAASHIR